MGNTKEKLAKCKLLLAGGIAEKIVLGSVNVSYQSAHKKAAFGMIKELVFEGLDPEQLPKQHKQELLTKAVILLQSCEQEVEKLLTEHKEQLLLIIEQLKEHKSLTGKELETLFKK